MNRFISGITFIFIFAIGASGAEKISLEDYQTSIREARSGISVYLETRSNQGLINISDSELELITKALSKVPREAEVEFRSRTLPAKNEWIDASESALKKEALIEKRISILRSIDDRLHSILIKAQDLADSGESQSAKDEEKRRLATILDREEYKPSAEEDESIAAKIYKRVMEWLRSLFPEAKPINQPSDMPVLRSVLQILIYGIAAALLIYVLFRFGPGLFRRATSKDEVSGNQLILGEEIKPGSTTEDLFAEAEALALSGDIRGAIRKGYISLLFELSQRKLIGLEKYKTNRDYLMDLRKHTELKNDVTGLTSEYERYWYGRKLAQLTAWEEFKDGYKNTLKRG